MVLREIGEADRGEAHRVEASHRERDGGRLEHACRVACGAHAREQAVQIGRLGRRQRERLAHAADPRLDGPEQPAPLPGGVEHRCEQERRGRLAVRAGDADHGEVLARTACEHVRKRPERRAHALGPHLGQRDVGERALHEQCARPARSSRPRELVAVA